MRLLLMVFFTALLASEPALASLPAEARPEPVRPLDASLGGGADGIVTGPARTLAWVLVGSGFVVGTLGVLVTTDQVTGTGDGVGPLLIGVGAISAIAGSVLIWTTGCISCGTCGIVENRPQEVPPPNEAFASGRERSDAAPTQLGLAFRF